jgi:hypothetical protein
VGWYGAFPQGNDLATGQFDWPQSFRCLNASKKNLITLWTEDNFLDQQAQMWSFLGDMLRSAGMLAPNYGNSSPQSGKPGGFGGFIHGDHLAGYSYLGGHPAGATYKILALIGHGAKIIDIYRYGHIL